jgi:putative AdoMet-dependent methyltransferase
MTIPDREELFDAWATKYDTSVADATFPLIGYEKVLDEAIAQAELWDGARALDVGTGTGNLAARLLAGGCGEVWGTDFSEEMLARARQKVPEAHFVRANLLEAWPDELPEQFNRIVSAYVFHEFDLETKLRLIGELNARLKPRGRLVIADIAFTTAEDREAAHRRWAGLWDEAEYYWAADEAIAALANAGIGARYIQVSICGGVFTIPA